MTNRQNHSFLKFGVSIATLFISMGLALPASAETKDEGDWQFNLTPYLWLTGIKGDTQIGSGPVAKLDMSPNEVLDVLDFGLMGSFEARRGRWGLFTDVVYAKLGGSKTVDGIRGVNGVTVDAKAEVKTTTVQLALTYRALEGEAPVDLFFGGRYNKQDIEADLSLNARDLINVSVNPQYDHSWWDPYVGVRISKPITDKLGVIAYGDVGGFGVGSDNTWQLMLGGNYRFTENVTATFGYRVLNTDYDDDGFKYDVKLDGVYVGANIGF